MKMIKRVVAGMLASVMILSSMGSVNAWAIPAEREEWYLYYSSSQNNTKQMLLVFDKFMEVSYTAEHIWMTPNTTCTLIQPGAGTTLARPSYVVSNQKISFSVMGATGSSVYILTVLSYLTSPATAIGEVIRPEIIT